MTGCVCSLSCIDLLHYSEELGWVPVVSCQVTDIWIPRVGLDLKEPWEIGTCYKCRKVTSGSDKKIELAID